MFGVHVLYAIHFIANFVSECANKTRFHMTSFKVKADIHVELGHSDRDLDDYVLDHPTVFVISCRDRPTLRFDYVYHPILVFVHSYDCFAQCLVRQ